MTVPVLDPLPSHYADGDQPTPDEINALIDAVAYGLIPERPALKIRRTSNQTVNNATATNVLYQDALFDNVGMWSIASSGLVTIQRAGIYAGCPQMRYSGATGTKSAYLLRNGTTLSTDAVGSANSAAGTTLIQALVMDRYAVGDVLRAYAFQDSGSPQSLSTDFGGTYLALIWMGI